MKTVLPLLLIFCSFTAVAQGWMPVGARSSSMGNASVALTDVWAFHHNPAGLSELKTIHGGISYESRFLLKELQSQSMVVAIPLKKGVVSVGGQFYGFQLYRSTRAGVGYSMLLSERLSMGVQLSYQGLRLTEAYGSKNTMTAEVGIRAKLTDKWSLGFSAFNVGRSKLSSYENDRFTALMRLGTRYKVSEKLLFVAEAEKDLDYALRAKVGMEYEALKQFYVRAGFATNPIEISFGFGYKWKMIQLDLGSAYHQQLGWSPHFSLTYSQLN